MDRRKAVMATAGIAMAIIVISFFYLAAPWADPPSIEEQSNPRMIFAPLLFVLGLILLCLSPVIYELLPPQEDETKE